MATALRGIVLLCLTFALWTVAAAGEPAGRGCELAEGWTRFGFRYFKFVPKRKIWVDAERHCISIGANLASIQSKEEYQFIRRLIFKKMKKHTSSWVGGYDAVKEGVWLWSDGSKFDFKRWGKNEPNNHNSEHCMEINFRGRDYVNDFKCHAKKSFVCAGERDEFLIGR